MCSPVLLKILAHGTALSERGHQPDEDRGRPAAAGREGQTTAVEYGLAQLAQRDGWIDRTTGERVDARTGRGRQDRGDHSRARGRLGAKSFYRRKNGLIAGSTDIVAPKAALPAIEKPAMSF
jgi:hypothetical protein